MDNKTIKEINDVNFLFFENIEIGTAAEIQLSIDNIKISSTIKNLIINILTKKQIKNKFIDSNIQHLFFYSIEYRQRKGHWDWFYKIGKVIKNSMILNFESREIRIDGFVFKLIFSWLKSLRKIEMPLEKKLRIIYLLLMSYDCINVIEEIRKKAKLKSVTVVCDAHAIDSIVVQYYNNLNIPTISLQHGIYSYVDPISIKNSKSTYLLVYGKGTKKECMNFGMKETKIITVGMPQLVGTEVKTTLDKGLFKRIGIIFDGSKYIKNDVEMLNVIKKAFNKKDFDLKVKFHPGTGIEKYDYDWGNFDCYDSETSINSFCENVDCIICAGSTVFIESLIKMIPVFLFKSSKPDIFLGINWCAFSTVEELRDLFIEFNKNREWLEEHMLTTREYLTCTLDVKKNYTNFYDSVS